MTVRTFVSPISGTRAQVGLIKGSKYAVVHANGQFTKVKKFEVCNAFECIKTLRSLYGTEIWRLV